MGARYLKNLFSTPLYDETLISERLDVIEALIKNDSLIKEQRVQLAYIRDIERIMAKVAMNKGSASDLINLAVATKAYEELLMMSKALPYKAEQHTTTE
jgi:DNA mismatch repair protein MutS